MGICTTENKHKKSKNENIDKMDLINHNNNNINKNNNINDSYIISDNLIIKDNIKKYYDISEEYLGKGFVFINYTSSGGCAEIEHKRWGTIQLYGTNSIGYAVFAQLRRRFYIYL